MEKIVVVKRKLLFEKIEHFNGIINYNPKLIDLIKNNYELMDRNAAEINEEYKQIIPYFVFKYKDKYFLMQRKKDGVLGNKYSIGIGGHMNESDISDSIIEWGMREFHEEVEYKGQFESKVIGFINDDSNPVGKVHFGILILIIGKSYNIKVKSELKSGFLATIDQINSLYEKLEGWSMFSFNLLMQSL
jgi:predicted NUDIX family phosphoesterase